ncbi:MAG: hypothetical protein AABW88_02080 [Nanoarchaeota archaeon]
MINTANHDIRVVILDFRHAVHANGRPTQPVELIISPPSNDGHIYMTANEARALAAELIGAANGSHSSV